MNGLKKLVNHSVLLISLLSAGKAMAAVEVYYHGNANVDAMSAVHRVLEDFAGEEGRLLLRANYRAYSY